MRNAQQQLQKAGRRFGGAGGGGPGPQAPFTAIGGLLLLAGGAYAFNNALFNGRLHNSLLIPDQCANPAPVDGGHRAIKYTRVGGVKPEIFNEGML